MSETITSNTSDIPLGYADSTVTSSPHVAALYFDLSCIDGRDAHYAATNGQRLLDGIQELDNYLRGLTKHGMEPECCSEWIDKIRDRLHEEVGPIWA